MKLHRAVAAMTALTLAVAPIAAPVAAAALILGPVGRVSQAATNAFMLRKLLA